MSLTQERINEIALECSLKFASEFLSRIREAQEPSGYFRDGWNGREEVSEIHKDEEGVTPLFTIPPASDPNEHDCKELVEALENKLRQIEKTALDIDAPCIQVPIIMQRIIESREAITKHKASMGEKE